jgi:hypothetical protein
MHYTYDYVNDSITIEDKTNPNNIITAQYFYTNIEYEQRNYFGLIDLNDAKYKDQLEVETIQNGDISFEV